MFCLSTNSLMCIRPLTIVWLYVLLICFANLSLTEDKEKWVWKTNDRDSKEFDRKHRPTANSRYEVFENDHYNTDEFRPGPSEFIRPDRPLGIHHEEGFPNRPFPNRPGVEVFIPNERPEDFYPNEGINQDVLTGPIPSWMREPPFRNYDTCKCAEKFNCNSPGVSYGQCDVGKQYCCYNRKGNALGGPIPSRPIHSPDNGILAGPGGPTGGPFRPNRPPHFYEDGQNNGVLIGPGGPHERPPPRPFQHENLPEFGVLAGPNYHNRPPPPGFGYGRNAKDGKSEN